MATRADKSPVKATNYSILPLLDGRYSVQKDGKPAYTIEHTGYRWRCNCKGMSFHPGTHCKHIGMLETHFAAEMEREADIVARWETMDISEWAAHQMAEMERYGVLW